LKRIASFAVKFWIETVGVVNGVGEQKIFRSITFSREVNWVMTRPKILYLYVPSATRTLTDIGMPQETQQPQGRNGWNDSTGNFRGRAEKRE
jgi:hypothetical protein